MRQPISHFGNVLVGLGTHHRQWESKFTCIESRVAPDELEFIPQALYRATAGSSSKRRTSVKRECVGCRRGLAPNPIVL